MRKDPYSILGVSPTDSEEDIKKAYRKLSKQYHPDVNGGNDEKFKEINKAYEDIINEKNNPQFNFGGNSINLEDLFGFHNFFSTHTRMLNLDIKININLTFKDIINGYERKIKIPYRKYYSNNSYQNFERSIDIKLPPGANSSHRFSMRAAGHESQHGVGDVIIQITEVDDSGLNLNRNGVDLYGEINVDLFDSILGAKKTVETPHGKLSFSIQPLTRPDFMFRLSGKGLPLLNSNVYGDLYLSVKIIYPQKLSKEQLDLIEKAKKLQDEK